MKYLREFDTMAKENFKTIKKAEKKLNQAKEQANLYRKGSGYNAETKAKEYRAQADLAEAQQEYDAALKTFKESTMNTKPIREKLEAALEEEYRIRPDKVDAVTLELMKAGVMQSSDYRHLVHEAKQNGNHTMLKLLNKYAKDAGDARYKTHGSMDREATLLHLAANEANENGGKEYLDSFDAMNSIYARCTENTAMIDHWGEFVHVDE